ncbi:hypothetical protein P154DRAFT_580858 [Amniculicola lignicola CBS 123094]|uniref:Uncharacterized protein n=1 Tax=Amniculicola lignicola CBS 123094 TaxID=1392246 RepID=A0A6A5W145_9PLEO|nr:hypothetical protein P154DRAFT_580858 [Amniculicola lignicola CBS 123094]
MTKRNPTFDIESGDAPNPKRTRLTPTHDQHLPRKEQQKLEPLPTILRRFSNPQSPLLALTTHLTTTLPRELRDRIYDILISENLTLLSKPLAHYLKPSSVGLPFALELAQRWYTQYEFFCNPEGGSYIDGLPKQISECYFGLGLDMRDWVRNVGVNLDVSDSLQGGGWVKDLEGYVCVKEKGILRAGGTVKVRFVVWLNGHREEMHLGFLDSRAKLLDCVEALRRRAGDEMVPSIEVDYYAGETSPKYTVGKGFKSVDELRNWGEGFPLRSPEDGEFGDQGSEDELDGDDWDTGFDVQDDLIYEEQAHAMSEMDNTDEEASEASSVLAYFDTLQ